MAACVSPNGLNTYALDGPTGQLLVGTAEGVSILDRQAGSWRVAGQALPGKHISSLLFETTRGGLFAGVHKGGLHFSADGGQTWQERMNGITVAHVFSLASAMENGQVVLY